jgi:hypothetical protein
MTDAPKAVATDTKEPVTAQDNPKPEVAGPVAAATPLTEPAVAKK